jgi:adenylylsulfate kinase
VGSNGFTVWITGLPSAGKTTLGRGVAARLAEAGHDVEILDGDVIRGNLGRDLGFSKEDRDENVRRTGFVASLLARHGVAVVTSMISPYRRTRDEVRELHQGRFFEVYVSTPVDVCERRDAKGLYARQRSGRLSGLTGVDDPYEPPLSPEVVVPAHLQSVDESVETAWGELQRWLGRERPPTKS